MGCNKYMVSIVVAIIALPGCSFLGDAKAPLNETVGVGACNPTPCARVTMDTLPELPATFSEEAKSSIRSQVERALYMPLDDSQGDVSRTGFVKSVQALYDDYMISKDPDVVVDWNVTRSASLLYSNESLASVVVRSVGYLGGAHGFNEETLFVFDGKTGRTLSWGDVISADSNQIFQRAAEAEFRRVRGLKPGQSLTDAGFSFEDDQAFGLPKNFAVTDRGIVCHYNPYEVGPYVLGPTEFTVPMDVVGAALNSQEAALKGLAVSAKRLL